MVNQNGTDTATKLRIIKKYPNRRLYDTKYSQYITLDDIHRLVKNKKPFQVIGENRDDALSRLKDLIKTVTVERKIRRPTKPSKGSRKRRMDEKSRRGTIKSLRGKVSD